MIVPAMVIVVAGVSVIVAGLVAVVIASITVPTAVVVAAVVVAAIVVAVIVAAIIAAHITAIIAASVAVIIVATIVVVAISSVVAIGVRVALVTTSLAPLALGPLDCVKAAIKPVETVVDAAHRDGEIFQPSGDPGYRSLDACRVVRMQIGAGQSNTFWVTVSCLAIVIGGGQLIAERDLLRHFQRTVVGRASHVDNSAHRLFEGVAEAEEILPHLVLIRHFFVVLVDGLDDTSCEIVERFFAVPFEGSKFRLPFVTLLGINEEPNEFFLECGPGRLRRLKVGHVGCCMQLQWKPLQEKIAKSCDVSHICSQFYRFFEKFHPLFKIVLIRVKIAHIDT